MSTLSLCMIHVIALQFISYHITSLYFISSSFLTFPDKFSRVKIVEVFSSFLIKSILEKLLLLVWDSSKLKSVTFLLKGACFA